MSLTLQEITDRIIVCGVSEMEAHLATGEVGGIVTVCCTSECNNSIDKEDGSGKTTAQEVIDKAKSSGVPHYQSLLYEMYGEFQDQFSPHEMTDDELKAYLHTHAEETISTIQDYLALDPNKKVIIHCVVGIDRSAVTALAYLLNEQGEKAEIDTTIRALRYIRPQAELSSVAYPFESYFGHRFAEYDAAITSYYKAMLTHKMMPETSTAREFLARMSGVRMYSSNYEEHAKTCRRFNISIP